MTEITSHTVKQVMVEVFPYLYNFFCTLNSIYVGGQRVLQLLISFTSFQKSLTLWLLSFLAREFFLMEFSFCLMNLRAYLNLAWVRFLGSKIGPCLCLPWSCHMRKVSLATPCKSATCSFQPGLWEPLHLVNWYRGLLAVVKQLIITS